MSCPQTFYAIRNRLVHPDMTGWKTPSNFFLWACYQMDISFLPEGLKMFSLPRQGWVGITFIFYWLLSICPRRWPYFPLRLNSDSCFQTHDSCQKSFLTLGIQKARAVIHARLCVCVCTFNRALTVGTAAPVRQTQPTPVPRVIPVIIAPFGVGAGVQLLIWSLYNELSRWVACRWCRPVPRRRRRCCASQLQDPSFVQGGEYRQHRCHVPFSQVNFHGLKIRDPSACWKITSHGFYVSTPAEPPRSSTWHPGRRAKLQIQLPPISPPASGNSSRRTRWPSPPACFKLPPGPKTRPTLARCYCCNSPEIPPDH